MPEQEQPFDEWLAESDSRDGAGPPWQWKELAVWLSSMALRMSLRQNVKPCDKALQRAADALEYAGHDRRRALREIDRLVSQAGRDAERCNELRYERERLAGLVAELRRNGITDPTERPGG